MNLIFLFPFYFFLFVFASDPDINSDPNPQVIPENQCELIFGTRGLSENERAPVTNNTLVTEKTILVVRVIAADSQTTANVSTLSNSVFGNSKQVLSLANQMSLCSFGKLKFVKITGKDVQDGILTLRSNLTVKGVDYRLVKSELVKEYGRQPYQYHANHVIFCVPPGTAGGWLAFAQMPGWYSFYNDGWCLSISGKMHEVGHNLGLDHQGTPTHKYGDASGYMGLSTLSATMPRMCYGAAQSSKLGWYNEKTKIIDMVKGESFVGLLHAFVDFPIATTVLVKLVDIPDKITYFVNFNSRKGFNNETVTSADKLLITSSKEDGSGSLLLAALSVPGLFNINKTYGSSFDYTIRFKFRRTEGVGIEIYKTESHATGKLD